MVLLLDSHQAVVNMHLDQASLQALAMVSMVLAQVNPLAMDNMVLLQDRHQAVVNMNLDQASLLAMDNKGQALVSPLCMVIMDLDQVSLLALGNMNPVQESPLAMNRDLA